MFFMGALAVLSKQVDFIPAGFLALGLSYAIQMIALLKYAVTVVCTLEAQFNAVQRVRHYGCNLDTEESAPITNIAVSDGKEGPDKPSKGGVNTGDVEMQLVPTHEPVILPPSGWPVTGSVVFENVQMRYRDGPLVLKGISFDVNGGEKIGIAGRTG
jgi:ABC-type multidrug transport system fused ATPase/permease subunit